MNDHKKKLAPRTSRRRMASMREFASWAGHREKLLPKFKLPSLGPGFPHPLPRLEKDLDALLDKCKTDVQRSLIALLGLEGMRLHEALSSKVDHFNLDDMTLDVWGKGDKLRTIPITERAWGFLAPRIIHCKVYNMAPIVTYSDRGARHFVTELGVRAGITRPIASHDLRGTFATLAYENSGYDIVLVQTWLGHASMDTTKGYVGITMSKMRAAGNF